MIRPAQSGLILAVVIAAWMSAPAAMAQIPRNTLLVGTMQYSHASVGDKECGTYGNGPLLSTFEVNSTAKTRTIGFPSFYMAIDRANQVSLVYGGVGVLSFQTATSGLVTLDYGAAGNDYPNASERVAFSDYDESINDATGIVSVGFSLDLHGCSMPFGAVFHAH